MSKFGKIKAGPASLSEVLTFLFSAMPGVPTFSFLLQIFLSPAPLGDRTASKFSGGI